MCSEPELLASAAKWLEEQSRFCNVMGDSELAMLSSNVGVIYTEKSVVDETVKLDIPSRWIFDYIADHVRNSRITNSAASYALFEVLYGIAADYYLAWYIASPLIDLDINFDLYFNFWKVGGVSALLNGKLLVAAVY
ncbi:hypothetical protein CSQ88_21650 [Iodobacter sp. BJB302]|nr:hypothetical protein CSQ88_21650 [Iodobacter sp. BJB302]